MIFQEHNLPLAYYSAWNDIVSSLADGIASTARAVTALGKDLE